MRPLLFMLIITPVLILGQEIKVLHPVLGKIVDKSKEGEKKHLEQVEKCATFWEDYHRKYGKTFDIDQLTEEESELFDECQADIKPYWDILGMGCSWYCGGGQDSVSASSALKPQKDINYSPSNAHDLSYKTAWVEGAPGYGIGEYLVYHVEPINPRITEIIVVNGYVKSDKVWKDNARVKKLKMYVNDTAFAILNLHDTKAEQHFEVEPLGVSKRDDWQEMKKMPRWTMKFEIVEVYPGSKYDDVAITEIYFDGIDVHCLAKGTAITLPDHTTRKIETLRVGDSILSYNKITREFQPAQVKALASPVHSGLVTLHFSNGSKLTCTKDHPLLSSKGEWLSLQPEKTMEDYGYDHVNLLAVGGEIITTDSTLTVDFIEDIEEELQTFTVVRLDKNNAFVANGVVVGTEGRRIAASVNSSETYGVKR